MRSPNDIDAARERGAPGTAARSDRERIERLTALLRRIMPGVSWGAIGITRQEVMQEIAAIRAGA